MEFDLIPFILITIAIIVPIAIMVYMDNRRIDKAFDDAWKRYENETFVFGEWRYSKHFFEIVDGHVRMKDPIE